MSRMTWLQSPKNGFTCFAGRRSRKKVKKETNWKREAGTKERKRKVTLSTYVDNQSLRLSRCRQFKLKLLAFTTVLKKEKWKKWRNELTLQPGSGIQTRSDVYRIPFSLSAFQSFDIVLKQYRRTAWEGRRGHSLRKLWPLRKAKAKTYIYPHSFFENPAQNRARNTVRNRSSLIRAYWQS